MLVSLVRGRHPPRVPSGLTGNLQVLPGLWFTTGTELLIPCWSAPCRWWPQPQKSSLGNWTLTGLGTARVWLASALRCWLLHPPCIFSKVLGSPCRFCSPACFLLDLRPTWLDTKPPRGTCRSSRGQGSGFPCSRIRICVSSAPSHGCSNFRHKAIFTNHERSGKHEYVPSAAGCLCAWLQ